MTTGRGFSFNSAIEYRVSAFGATTQPSLVVERLCRWENWLTGASPCVSGSLTLVIVL